MKILIVSGFLGAGKTTFIKELIRRSGTRPVIMENEYGENNLDAQELERVIESPSPAPDGAPSPASGRGQALTRHSFAVPPPSASGRRCVVIVKPPVHQPSVFVL